MQNLFFSATFSCWPQTNPEQSLKMIVRKRVALLAVLGFLCQSCHAMLQLQVDITKAVVCSDQAEEGDKVGHQTFTFQTFANATCQGH